jgi:hypothetical protein
MQHYIHSSQSQLQTLATIYSTMIFIKKRWIMSFFFAFHLEKSFIIVHTKAWCILWIKYKLKTTSKTQIMKNSQLKLECFRFVCSKFSQYRKRSHSVISNYCLENKVSSLKNPLGNYHRNLTILSIIRTGSTPHIFTK